MDMVVPHAGMRLLTGRVGSASGGSKHGGQGRGTPTESAGGGSARRDRGLRPTRGPFGEVPWWERPAPGGHEALWTAVKRLQRRRLQLGVRVTHLAERMDRLGHPVSRETLSRVLNGKQPTSWVTVEVMAEALSADVPEIPDED